jgi:purine-binding chemotaxis protein CheW
MSDAVSQAAAMRQVVVFMLDKEEYAASIEDVKEVIKLPEITPVPGGREYIVGIINLRGKIIPVLDLEKLFNLTRVSDAPATHLLVVEDVHGTLFAVSVNEVKEILKIPADAIKPAPKMVTSKISSDYLEGVIINKGSADSDKADSILLLIKMQKIVTEKITQSLKEVVKTS